MKDWIWYWIVFVVLMLLVLFNFVGCAGGAPMTYEQRMGLLYAAQGLQRAGENMREQSVQQPVFYQPQQPRLIQQVGQNYFVW